MAQAPPIKKGWLKKQGRGFVRTWKRRYVVLDSGILRYYEDKMLVSTPPYGESLKGSLSLFNVSVVEAGSGDNRRILLTGSESEPDLLMEAESKKDAIDWITALKSHCKFALIKNNASNSTSPSGIDSSTSAVGKMLNQISTSPDRDDSSERENSNNQNGIPNRVQPIPGFVIKVLRAREGEGEGDSSGSGQTGQGEKVFINVSHSPSVPPGSAERGSPRWPFMISSGPRTLPDEKRDDRDSVGSVSLSSPSPSMVTVYDLVLSSSVMQVCDDPTAKDEVCHKALKYVSSVYREYLQKEYRLPKIQKKYKGELVLVPVPPNLTELAFPASSSPSPPPSYASPSPLPSRPSVSGSSRSSVSKRQAFKQMVGRTQSLGDQASSLSSSSYSYNMRSSDTVLPSSLSTSPQTKEKMYIPYEVRVVAGVAAKLLPEKTLKASRILPQGERLLVSGRKVNPDGSIWLNSNKGWIMDPSSSPMPSSRESVSDWANLKGRKSSALLNREGDMGRYDKLGPASEESPPSLIKVTSTRFVERQDEPGARGGGSFFSYLFGRREKPESGLYHTLFLLDVVYSDRSVLKLSRTLDEIMMLRAAVLKKCAGRGRDSKSAAGSVVEVTERFLPSELRDGDEALLTDTNMMIHVIETTEQWLNGLVSALRVDDRAAKDRVGAKARQDLLDFVKPLDSDCLLMEAELMAEGGVSGMHKEGHSPHPHS